MLDIDKINRILANFLKNRPLVELTPLSVTYY